MPDLGLNAKYTLNVETRGEALRMWPWHAEHPASSGSTAVLCSTFTMMPFFC